MTMKAMKPFSLLLVSFLVTSSDAVFPFRRVIEEPAVQATVKDMVVGHALKVKDTAVHVAVHLRQPLQVACSNSVQCLYSICGQSMECISSLLKNQDVWLEAIQSVQPKELLVKSATPRNLSLIMASLLPLPVTNTVLNKLANNHHNNWSDDNNNPTRVLRVVVCEIQTIVRLLLLTSLVDAFFVPIDSLRLKQAVLCAYATKSFVKFVTYRLSARRQASLGLLTAAALGYKSGLFGNRYMVAFTILTSVIMMIPSSNGTQSYPTLEDLYGWTESPRVVASSSSLLTTVVNPNDSSLWQSCTPRKLSKTAISKLLAGKQLTVSDLSQQVPVIEQRKFHFWQTISQAAQQDDYFYLYNKDDHKNAPVNA